MPQFDTTFFTSQIFWTIVSFIILFVALSRWVLPRIANIIQERTRLIEAEIEDARKKSEQMESLKNEYETKLSEIDKEAKKIFHESEERAIKQRNRIMDEWKNDMEKRKRIFLEDAEVIRQQAIRDIRKQSGELVAVATEHLIHQKVDDIEAQKVLDASIDELKKEALNKN